MPTDANGVYSLPPGYLAVTGETIQASQHNPPLEDLESSMTERLMRSGAAPMTGPIKLADGSASAPSATFNSAVGTGWYKTTNGIGVAVNGSQVAEFTSSGLAKGGRYIGEIFDYVGSTAPPLCVLPYGQTLSRTAYAALWAFAQVEIAAGNAFFNNGNGSTTFGIGDLRGRVRAAKDNMGGVTASRLTSTYFGGAETLGAVGGLQSTTLVTQNLPPYTPSGSVFSSGTVTLDTALSLHGVGAAYNDIIGEAGTGSTAKSLSISSSFTGVAQGGTSTPLRTIQPTIITNCALFAGA